MKRPYVSKTLKNRIIKQAKDRCAYCLTPQHLLAVKLEIEHIIPLSKGGSSNEDNLCLSCPTCNMYKGSKIEANDPKTDQMVPIFNPRCQNWFEHFKWSKGGTEINGISATGRATVTALKLNNQLSVIARRYWGLLKEFPPLE